MINDHTAYFLAMLAGIDTVYDFRAIHDRDRSADGRALRGTIAQCADTLTAWQSEGYAPHVMINATDGLGRLVANVTDIRAQLVDLDGPNRVANLQRLMQWQPLPHIVVNTSPTKAHVWWMTTPHRDKQLFTDNQRRLIGEFQGDPQFVDVAHTARLPGFWHLKAEPHFVTLSNTVATGSSRVDPWRIAGPLMHIDVKQGQGDRKPLGTPSMAAPTWELLAYAVGRIDPNSLGFQDWIAITASIKQAGWVFGEANVRGLWDWWCSHHRQNDLGENNKQWRQITATASGWSALTKSAGIQAELMFGNVPTAAVAPVGDAVAAVTPDANGTVLFPAEQAVYFNGCFWIDEVGKILTPNGRLLDSTRFNAKYGGKLFVLDGSGSKFCDEPWKAATRGQVWQVPKVDHMRFLPREKFGMIVGDEFGRKGVNSYMPIVRAFAPGDCGPFWRHCENILPNEQDRRILYAFLAQCVQRPGVKIKWAVLIQSAEGAGKSIFRLLMEHALGASYIHTPNAKELTEGGGKFNGWVRNRLMIIVDEIRTDERFNLIEVLKPMITEERIEIQNKGQDQAMADNPSNWLMFTNYDDALPINDNSRRITVMYSAIQSLDDLLARGMTGEYFSTLYTWAKNGGYSAVCHWLATMDIPPDLDAEVNATRAPYSSTHKEVLAVSRSSVENLILEASGSNLQGFRNGWVSTVALNNLMKEAGLKIGPRGLSSALKNLKYKMVGKASKPFIPEFSKFQSTLYHFDKNAPIINYGKDQGYET